MTIDPARPRAPADRTRAIARTLARGLAAGALSMLVCTGARAAIVNLDFDLLIADTEVIPRVFGDLWQTQQLTFPPPAIASGDTVVVTANILDGSVAITDLASDPDTLEGVFFAMGFGGAISADAPLPYTWEFLGAGGALDVNPVLLTGVLRDTTFGVQATTNQGQGLAVVDLTGSSFTFTGIRLTLEMPNVITSPFSPSSIRLAVAGDAAQRIASQVPAPAPAALLAAGLLAFAARARRRRS